jgi:hypothetical protein
LIQRGQNAPGKTGVKMRRVLGVESVEVKSGIRWVPEMREELRGQEEETSAQDGTFILARWTAAAVPRSASILEGPSFYHGKTLQEILN